MALGRGGVEEEGGRAMSAMAAGPSAKNDWAGSVKHGRRPLLLLQPSTFFCAASRIGTAAIYAIYGRRGDAIYRPFRQQRKGLSPEF
jgi:hypothetical protein